MCVSVVSYSLARSITQIVSHCVLDGCLERYTFVPFIPFAWKFIHIKGDCFFRVMVRELTGLAILYHVNHIVV